VGIPTGWTYMRMQAGNRQSRYSWTGASEVFDMCKLVCDKCLKEKFGATAAGTAMPGGEMKQASERMFDCLQEIVAEEVANQTQGG
jgi:hypothetical protein